jgi:hypothetical protein
VNKEYVEMDSESLRLPPELWDKIVWYLVYNDGFVENLDLLHLLYQIQDAVYGLERHMGYWPEYKCLFEAKRFESPAGIMEQDYYCQAAGTAIDIQIYYHPSFLFLKEIVVDKEFRLHTEWNHKHDCEKYTETSDFSCVYSRLPSLPHGIRLTVGSNAHPWFLEFMYPSRNEKGELCMRQRHIAKDVLGFHKTSYYGPVFEAYSLIDLRYLDEESASSPPQEISHFEPCDWRKNPVVNQLEVMFGNGIGFDLFSMFVFRH